MNVPGPPRAIVKAEYLHQVRVYLNFDHPRRWINCIQLYKSLAYSTFSHCPSPWQLSTCSKSPFANHGFTHTARAGPHGRTVQLVDSKFSITSTPQCNYYNIIRTTMSWYWSKLLACNARGLAHLKGTDVVLIPYSTTVQRRQQPFALAHVEEKCRFYQCLRICFSYPCFYWWFGPCVLWTESWVPKACCYCSRATNMGNSCVGPRSKTYNAQSLISVSFLSKLNLTIW